jgi:hypothetical protein
MEERYIAEKQGKRWLVFEVVLGFHHIRLEGLTEWQAKAICAILNKGK